MQCGAFGKHKNTLSPDTQTLEEKFLGQSEVRSINFAPKDVLCAATSWIKKPSSSSKQVFWDRYYQNEIFD